MQKIIINSSQKWFEEEVNKHLCDGWRVIPNTMNVSLFGYKAEGHFYPNTVESYVVFLEKPEPKLKNKTSKKLLKG